MTTTVEPPTEQAAPATDVRTRLRAAAGRRAAPKRRATTRKATGTQSRATTAAKKGKHSDRIIGAVKSGAALLSVKDPVRGAILKRQAEPFARALDRVAAEDPRVDAFLLKLGGLFGKSGAWGELGQVALTTGGAMILAGGTVPAGPAGIVLAFVAGSLLEEATQDAAQQLAAAHLDREYPGWHVAGTNYADMHAELVAGYVAELRKPPPAGSTDIDAAPDVDQANESDPYGTPPMFGA